MLSGSALRTAGCCYCEIAIRHHSDWVWCQVTLPNKVSPFCINLILCSFFSGPQLLCCGTARSDRPHRRLHLDHPAGLSPVLFADFYKAFLVLPVYWHCLLISPLVQNRTKTECIFTSSTNTSDAVVLKFTALAVTRFYVPTLCGKQNNNALKNTHLNITASTMVVPYLTADCPIFIVFDKWRYVKPEEKKHCQVSSSKSDCK